MMSSCHHRRAPDRGRATRVCAPALALALSTLASPVVQAESARTVGSGPAAARLNFRVLLAHSLFLGVGTGANVNPRATHGTVDDVTFDYSNNQNAVGTGAAPGQTLGASVPVRVYGNRGQITVTVSHPASLTSGVNAIPFTQIQVTSSNFFFPAPAMGGGPVYPWRNGFGISQTTDRSATWTFTYLNQINVPGGVYQGQATYTASML
jgi:hypothetical protein